MGAPEDVMGSHSSSSTGTGLTVLKRKRSKRPAPPPPAPPVGAATSSSTPSADYLSSATEEEEDMAHCLILLAQGHALADSSPPLPPADKFTSRRFTETTTTAGGKAGFYVYECKTCNKCFPSFQALGGHRASHKKPKMAAIPTVTTTAATAEDKNLIIMNDSIVDGSSTDAFLKPAATVNAPTANSPASNNSNKMRVHECSICGAEFSSGQALGGHMRRHRPIGAAPSSPTQEVVVLKKERNVLSLDLNLPAPSDENPQPPPPPPVAASAFSFADKRPMVFSATSLVDCHY